jgi:N-formylglutamate amidohydrolase
MDTGRSQAAAAAISAAPFCLLRPPAGAESPLIFASPHSGRIYPAQMMAASVLDDDQIRSSEDAHVDALIEGAPALGASVLLNRFARAYVDVNREPYELDPAMFEDELPAYAKGRSARVAAGLGSIARVVANGQEIYRRKLTFAEAKGRIEGVHLPYHAALGGLIDEARARFGRALVVDWHSMPSAAARTGQGEVCDFVLGDRYGRACGGAIVETAERLLSGMGYRVARNAPYAGGYTTEHYGRPEEGVHALQIEISRRLYLDEQALSAAPAFAGLKKDLEILFAALVAWPG